jgi:hypothetical protein
MSAPADSARERIFSDMDFIRYLEKKSLSFAGGKV